MWTYGDLPSFFKLMALLIAILTVVLMTKYARGVLANLEGTLVRLAQRPWCCAAILFALSVGLNFGLASFEWPEPRVHDEFSYLLASDTFLEGRLTNEVHPMSEHFETMHVLAEPSVTSKYPPGNSAFLALGQTVFGQPIIGIWLALGLAVVACFWMFRAWTTPAWSFAGGLILAIHQPILHGWGQSYWGGAVAFLAGALVFGGLRRIYRDGLMRDAIMLSIGMVLLANSRPMEGLLVSIPVGGMLVWWFLKSKQDHLSKRLMRVGVPLLLLGAVGLGTIGVYNKAVTGHFSQLPYQAHDETYSAFSMLIWKPQPEVPAYHVDRMEDYFTQFRERQQNLRSMDHYVPDLMRRLGMLFTFYPLALGMVLFTLPKLCRDRWSLAAIVMTLGILIIHSQMITSWIFPHYLAPVAALFFAVSVAGLREVSFWRPEVGAGKGVVRFVFAFSALKLLFLFLMYHQLDFVSPRAVVQKKLDDSSSHLVIVSYAPDYSIHNEWVYNRADIDRAPIVFARDLGEEKNQKLISYFGERQVWRWHLTTEDETNIEPMDRSDFQTTGLTTSSVANHKMKGRSNEGY